MKLYEKLMEVRRAVDYLQKAQRNEQQKFDYVSSAQVLGTVRVKMNEHGLLLRPQIIKTVFHHKGSDSMHVTELKMTMTWIDTESGEKEVNLWYAQGTDQHEKGVGKALTYAEKFFILKYFNIPTDKWDPDAWSEKFGGHNEPPAKKNAPNRPQEPDLSPSEGEGVEMPTIGGSFANHSERIKAFIGMCQQFKKILGEEGYYEVLKQHGYQKSNAVRKRDDMNAIFKDFKQAVADMMGGEVGK